MTKKCKDCNKTKPQSAFYGIQGECKECTKARVNKRYKDSPDKIRDYEQRRSKNPKRKVKMLEYQRERRKREPEKYKARGMVSNSIRDGKLIKLPCEVCGVAQVEAHHEDYSKPLEVVWVCRKHHYEIEGKRFNG